MAEQTTPGPKATTAAAAGAGLILFTLAAGQFLMALDMSVMNVSIATVAKDVGTTVTGIQTAITLYTLVMASLMVLGGKIGSIIGFKRAFSIGCIIYGCGSATTALAPNLTVLDHRLVVPRGHRRRAHHARHRRPRSQQLPAQGAAEGLRPGLRGGGDRGRRGARYRRFHDDLLLVALRVRRRGRHRHRHPAAGAPCRRLARRPPPAPRPGGRRDLVDRARAVRDRRAQVVDLGLGPAQVRRKVAVRPLADDLVHAGRPLRAVAVLPLPAAARAHRQGAADRAGAAQEPADDRRAHQLPVHVPHPVRCVLHRAAVSLGGPRLVAHRDGCAPAAALAVAAAGRRRHSAPAPERQSAPRRALRHPGTHRRHRRAHRQPGGRAPMPRSSSSPC